MQRRIVFGVRVGGGVGDSSLKNESLIVSHIDLQKIAVTVSIG